ncbi:MAG: glycosyltransferase [Bacteroidales bacterium]
MTGKEIKKPVILVAPLEWGLGHATRLVPVIRKLIESDLTVIAGADGLPLEFLREEFPGLRYVRIPGYRFSYPSGSAMTLKMLLQAPVILRGIRREHRLLAKIIREYEVDAVISDNRFGLWSNEVVSVYMTHQLFIQPPARLPWLKGILARLHHRYIRRYDFCWVPDFADKPNLSGELSHGDLPDLRIRYMGPLSRFEVSESESSVGQAPDVLALVSGPEPQRTLFEELLTEALKNHPGHHILAAGLPGTKQNSQPRKNGNLTLYNHLPSKTLSGMIRGAKTIICRPGYSTLMDLACFGKKAILIPTPGQTEQEYLAQHLEREGLYPSFRQDNFDLNEALEKLRDYRGIRLPGNHHLLQEAVNELLMQLSRH